MCGELLYIEFRAKIGARRNKNEVIQVSFKIHYWKEQEYAHAGGNVKEIGA